MIQITKVGVTTMQERTWGRVYVNYTFNGKEYFIFKNFIRFSERNYQGEGSFENEPAYTWFHDNHTASMNDALDGKLDDLYLTPAHYEEDFGTPSILLKSLLNDLEKLKMTSVENRRGWYTEQ